jgi:hypothetical protein
VDGRANQNTRVACCGVSHRESMAVGILPRGRPFQASSAAEEGLMLACSCCSRELCCHEFSVRLWGAGRFCEGGARMQPSFHVPSDANTRCPLRLRGQAWGKSLAPWRMQLHPFSSHGCIDPSLNGRWGRFEKNASSRFLVLMRQSKGHQVSPISTRCA